jgi:hypothetical protein
MAYSQTISQSLWLAKQASNYYAPAPAFLNGRYIEMTFYVLFSHTSDSGVITIETAPYNEYAGTWAPIATMTWAAIDTCKYTSVTGAFGAIRARISTVITAGSCDVWMVASTPTGS